MAEKKIAFGIITRELKKLSPLTDFLDNALKYGHYIDKLIIGYQIYVDPGIIKHLEKYCEVILIQRGNCPFLINSLKKLGLSNEETEILLATPFLEKYGMVAYGTSRNYNLLTAIFSDIRYLYFFDTDIFPKILNRNEKNEYFFEDIDFVGSHLKYLKQSEDVVVTTSDYTGYYIIPRMDFPDLEKLLVGVQKENSYEYIKTVDSPVVQEQYLKNIRPTNKILGGNLAIDLNKIEMLPPFFSTTLVIDDECIKGRGEDTLFGPLINKSNGLCLDIDLLIFHNCFGDFPEKPEITIQKNIDRFYYACMGWIIRNPFYNWLHSEYIRDLEKVETKQRLEALKIGSKAAAEYFMDKRFLKLPRAFEMAYTKLDQDIEYFNRLMETWDKMKRLLK